MGFGGDHGNARPVIVPGVTGFLAFMSLGLALAIAAACLLEARRLRRPPRRTYAWAVSRGVPADPGEATPPRRFTAFSFNGPGGAAHPAWEVEGGDPDGPIVIATPGWGDSRLGIIPRLAGLVPRASKIVAWDPPGLGEAPGRCNLGTRRDVEALLSLVETDCPHPSSLKTHVSSSTAGPSALAYPSRPPWNWNGAASASLASSPKRPIGSRGRRRATCCGWPACLTW